jgi:hypothetical protein
MPQCRLEDLEGVLSVDEGLFYRDLDGEMVEYNDRPDVSWETHQFAYIKIYYIDRNKDGQVDLMFILEKHLTTSEIKYIREVITCVTDDNFDVVPDTVLTDGLDQDGNFSVPDGMEEIEKFILPLKVNWV